MESVTESKRFEFAVEVVKTAKEVRAKHREYDLTKQLMRSGTSIGANVSEAQKSQSRKEFIAKMSIASKEANETRYWIRLMTATGYLEEETGSKLEEQAEELIKLLTRIVKSTQEKGNTQHLALNTDKRRAFVCAAKV